MRGSRVDLDQKSQAVRSWVRPGSQADRGSWRSWVRRGIRPRGTQGNQNQEAVMRENRAMEGMRLLASLDVPLVNLRILAMQWRAQHRRKRDPRRGKRHHQPKATRAHTMGTPWEIAGDVVATWLESLGR